MNLEMLARHPLADLIDRYKKEVTPTKRGAVQEKYRLGVVKADKVATLNIKSITSADVAAFRDRRLCKVKPVTARHDLCALSGVFEHARREWSYPAVFNRHNRRLDANPSATCATSAASGSSNASGNSSWLECYLIGNNRPGTAGQHYISKAVVCQYFVCQVGSSNASGILELLY